MKRTSSPSLVIEAMKINDATVAYFIIEKPRLGAEEYNRIVTQAKQNKLQIYKNFHYKGPRKTPHTLQQKTINS